MGVGLGVSRGHMGVASGGDTWGWGQEWDKRHVSKSSDTMHHLEHALSYAHFINSYFINSHHHDNTNRTTEQVS